MRKREFKGRAIGKLGVPTNNQIDFDKISHRITELRQDGNLWRGKAAILENKVGQGILDGGGALGVSDEIAGLCP